MPDDRDYILDLGSGKAEPPCGESGPRRHRSYISVYFECCGVYNRIYRNREGTAYSGWCPRCLRKVNVRIGAGGVSCRFFRAT